MKQDLIKLLNVLSIFLPLSSVILKFFLWIQLKSYSRINFFRSYIIWFTIRDIYDASSSQSIRFRKWNNPINIFFWIGIIILIILFVIDVDPIKYKD